MALKRRFGLLDLVVLGGIVLLWLLARFFDVPLGPPHAGGGVA